MTRRRRLSAPSPDRWLISYADFITLLFAFFVVLYAVAQNDRAKARDVSESVKRAFGGTAAPTRTRPAPKSVAPVTVDQLAPAFAHLQEQLQQEIADGKMQVSMDARGIIVSLHEGSFFPSGGDTIYPAAFDSIAKVAAVVRDLPNPVRLEGHTDSVPIHNQRFRSNWDLSAARSIAVLLFFEERFAVAGQRFAIAGYADNLPVAGNDSDEGRSKNRRVDIVIAAPAH
ncbi:MAG: flagellar motor protein MotB [Candidatus Solibacter sp.]